MDGKELKKLSRRELVDIIYQMKKNEQQMQEEIAALQTELQDKRLRYAMAGTLAETAASVSNVFSAAQMTADLYLQEITAMKEATERECAKMIEEANKTVDRIFQDEERQYANLSIRYRNQYKKFQRLKEEVELLEEKKKQESHEE